MSLDDYVLEIEGVAEQVAIEAKAVYRCPAHPYVTIRNADCDAESHAFALMTLMWKAEGGENDRLMWTDALRNHLIHAADRCPECEALAAA